MLEHLGFPEWAKDVVGAIEATTSMGITTPDLGGHASTTEVGDAIVSFLR